MRAFMVPEFGAAGYIAERSRPEPGEGEIRVRVLAAGVNALDAYAVSGVYKDYMEHRLPLTPGIEYAGVVDAVGEGVDSLAPGDDVFGGVGKPHLGEGSWAEYVTVNAAFAAPRPGGLHVADAAGLAVAGTTALALLESLELDAGKTVLVVGAAGGVGSFATQLAALAGLRIVAVTSGRSADFVRDLGAIDVIDYTAGELAVQVEERYPDGVDGAIDLFHDVQGLADVVPLVRPGGRVSSPKAVGADEAFAGQPVTAVLVNATFERAGELGELAAQGKIRVPLTTLSFDKAATALEGQSNGSVRGKQVLTIQA
jgi:NADPH:quinone reductase-like Zn-dependent oxidoreductase